MTFSLPTHPSHSHPAPGAPGFASTTGEAGTRDAWTCPGAFEEAPGVYRVPLPLPNDGLRAVNVYVLPHDGGVELIDGGWAVTDGEEALATALGCIGHELADVTHVFVTHVHRDHYSQALALRRRFGAGVSLGQGEQASLAAVRRAGWRPFAAQLALLRDAGATELHAHFTNLAFTGRPIDPELYEDPDEWLAEGEVDVAGRRVQVVETPGHTQGHLVFRDGYAGLLFAGDHVLPAITPSIGFEPATGPDPLGAFLGSLARLRALPDARLLPAHGPVTDSVHRRIDELVEHHGRRLEQVEGAVQRGATTSLDVAAMVRWTRRELPFAGLDPFNQMLAVVETDAHLRLLVSQGRLVRRTTDGVVHHAPSVRAEPAGSQGMLA